VASGASPGEASGEDAVSEVQDAPPGEEFAALEAQSLALDQKFQAEEVWDIGEFAEIGGHGVEDAVDECRALFSRVALLECAAYAQVAVADGEDGFLVVEAFWLEGFLDDRPARVVVVGPRGWRTGEGLGDSGPRDPIERWEDGVGVADALGRSEAHRPHSGQERGGDPCGGVLDHEALVGRDAEHLGGSEEKVGGGLRPLGAVAVGQSVNLARQPEAFDDGSGVLARRADGHLDAGPAQFVEQFQGARKQVGGGDPLEEFLVVAVFPLGHLVESLGRDFSVAEDYLEGALAGDAAQLLVDLAVEGDALLVGQALPRLVVEFGGVGHDAVEVENDAPDGWLPWAHGSPP